MDKLSKYKILFDSTLLKGVREFWQTLYWYRKFPNARVSFVGLHLKERGRNLHVRIGDESYSFPITLFASDKIKTEIDIGSGCHIGQEVMFVLSPNYEKGNLSKIRKDESSFLRIEDDAWIGARAIIMQNVRIGKGAQVGAGAVVTRDVAPYDVVAGVPAKSIVKK
jgi:acetyltransferase-like isoleucine patch superfamily enzyme